MISVLTYDAVFKTEDDGELAAGTGKWGQIGEQNRTTRLAKGRAVLPQVFTRIRTSQTFVNSLASFVFAGLLDCRKR